MKKELNCKQVKTTIQPKELQGNGICSYSQTVDFEKFLKEIKL